MDDGDEVMLDEMVYVGFGVRGLVSSVMVSKCEGLCMV